VILPYENLHFYPYKMEEVLLFHEEVACFKKLFLTGLDFVIPFDNLRFEGLLEKYLLYSFVYQTQLYVNLISLFCHLVIASIIRQRKAVPLCFMPRAHFSELHTLFSCCQYREIVPLKSILMWIL
jgi:hypothetical protein